VLCDLDFAYHPTHGAFHGSCDMQLESIWCERPTIQSLHGAIKQGLCAWRLQATSS